MLVCGAILHLVAPGAIADRIPPAKWVRICTSVAVVLFAAVLVVWWFDRTPDLTTSLP